MNILLTGASGFVGRATLAYLRDLPKVNVRLGLRTAMPRFNEFHQFEIGNLGSATNWTEALKDTDTVIHLAARVHVMNDRAADPLAEFRAVNVAATQTLAQQAAQTGVRRMVYLSSVKVLGESSTPGISLSEDSPCVPCDPYAISKLEAENVLRLVGGQSGMEIVILRPPLVHGPGVGANFAALMRAVRRGIPLPLGCIRNRRSLIGVGNLASAIALCSHHQAAANQTFLVSDQHDVSTPELAQELAKAMNRSAHLLPVPVGWLKTLGNISGKSAAIDRLCGDMQIDSSKITRMLGWRPALSLQESLVQTVAVEDLA
jgi:UDP-glucose 4-epimerase